MTTQKSLFVSLASIISMMLGCWSFCMILSSCLKATSSFSCLPTLLMYLIATTLPVNFLRALYTCRLQPLRRLLSPHNEARLHPPATRPGILDTDHRDRVCLAKAALPNQLAPDIVVHCNVSQNSRVKAARCALQGRGMWKGRTGLSFPCYGASCLDKLEHAFLSSGR